MDIINLIWRGRFIFAVGIIILINYIWEKATNTEDFLNFRLRFQPRNAIIHYKLGNLFSEKKDFLNSIVEFRQTIALNPYLLESHRALIFTLLSQPKNSDQEKEIFEEVQRLIAKMEDLFPLDPMAQIYKGSALEIQKSFNEAESAFQKAILLEPRFSLGYYNLGRLLEKQKRFDEAANATRKAIELESGNVEFHFRLAHILHLTENYPAAEKELKLAIRSDPNEIPPYTNLCILLIEQNRNQEAKKEAERGIKLLKKTLKSTPPNNSLFFDQAIFLHIVERHSEATESYHKFIQQIEPNDYSNIIGLARLLNEFLDRPNEAEEVYRQAIDLDPEVSEGYFQLGLLLHEKFRRYDEAEKLFIKTLEINPLDQVALYNLACIQSLRHNTAEAFSYLEQAIEKGLDKTGIWQDPDLDWIKDDPRFEQIIGPKPE